MRKLIIATTALAFVSSTALIPSVALAQDKGAATSDTTTKSNMTKTSKKKSKKATKGTTDDMQKQ
jgi:hypothetical protein